MKKEIWKDIPGNEGRYQVSNLGRVYSLPKTWVGRTGGLRSHNGVILKQSDRGNGYYVVTINKKSMSVHQLVAMAFLNHTPNKHDMVVDHINNIRTDNRLDNLQVVTQRVNSNKDRDRGSSKFVGVSRHSTSKNRWTSVITINGKQIYLGLFKSEEEASEAYKKELIKSNKK
jgi:hypothetical protein